MRHHIRQGKHGKRAKRGKDQAKGRKTPIVSNLIDSSTPVLL
jgi:hypothetical protein